MIAGLDSAYPPTQTQAQQARASGVRGWYGYIATKGGTNLLNPWSQADFQVVHQVFGAQPIGFCSGRDDPAAVKAQAANWGVRPCLDVENGIRADGNWVQPWLDASGAGLYGLQSVFHGRQASFFVMAGYPGQDPGVTWAGTPPGVPHGWQWQGSHVEFGVTVDRGWYDDWFGVTADPPPQEEHHRMLIVFAFNGGTFVSDGINYRWVVDQWDYNALFIAWGSGVRDIGNINGLQGFGVPADPVTAHLTQQPWPAPAPAPATTTDHAVALASDPAAFLADRPTIERQG
jgi:hypothetical protein